MDQVSLKIECSRLAHQLWDFNDPKKRKEYYRWVHGHLGVDFQQADVRLLTLLKRLLETKLETGKCFIHQKVESSKDRHARLTGWHGDTKKRMIILKKLISRDGQMCSGGCGKQLDVPSMTIDHITPIYLGGKGDISNLQILCDQCHFKKSEFELKDAWHRYKKDVLPGRLRDAFKYLENEKQTKP